MSRLADPLTAILLDLLPMLERIRRLDPAGVVRLQIGPDVVAALAPLPVGVIAARTLRIPGGEQRPADVTVGVAALADVLAAIEPDAEPGPLHLPPRRDADWRVSAPPRAGWTRRAMVADDHVRAAVRAAATAVKAAPLAAAAEMALDAPAFPNHADPRVAALTRRGPSALVKLGFCPRNGPVAVDVAGRWTRLVAAYGSVYVGGSAAFGNRAGHGGPMLNLLT